MELFRLQLFSGTYFTCKLIETTQPSSSLWSLLLVIDYNHYNNYSPFPVDIFCIYFLIFFNWFDLGNCMPSCIDTHSHISEMPSVSVFPLGYSYNVSCV
jgi:hypothetical protein